MKLRKSGEMQEANVIIAEREKLKTHVQYFSR